MREQSSESDTIYDDTSSPWWRPSFYAGVACVISLNVLYIVRKMILAAYGYGIGFDWRGYDRRKLQDIARNQTSLKRRRLFNLINTLIFVLVIGLLISFFLSAAIGLYKAGFGRLVFDIVRELIDKFGGRSSKNEIGIVELLPFAAALIRRMNTPPFHR